MPLIKLIGAANFSVAHDCSEISPFVPQEHQIRMLSDKCNETCTLNQPKSNGPFLVSLEKSSDLREIWEEKINLRISCAVLNVANKVACTTVTVERPKKKTAKMIRLSGCFLVLFSCEN